VYLNVNLKLLTQLINSAFVGERTMKRVCLKKHAVSSSQHLYQVDLCNGDCACC